MLSLAMKLRVVRMTSTTPSTPQPPRSDGEAIDWTNVAVKTAVVLRLQQAPPEAAASPDDPRR